MGSYNDDPIDYYYYVSDSETTMEGHILCTPAQAKDLLDAFKDILPTADEVRVEPGGEYDWVLTSDQNINAQALEMLDYNGFALPVDLNPRNLP